MGENLKNKETFSERQEYLETRKVYIEGARNASDRFHATVISLATGGFIYVLQLIRSEQTDNHYLIRAWLCFVICIAFSLFIYYFSGKAHNKQLDVLDELNEKKCGDKKSVQCIQKMQSKVDTYNSIIGIGEFLALIAITFGIVLMISAVIC